MEYLMLLLGIIIGFYIGKAFSWFTGKYGSACDILQREDFDSLSTPSSRVIIRGEVQTDLNDKGQ